MATFAEEWYDRSGGVVLKQDITEAQIVSSYSLTGNEVVSWDASAGNDGSVMAYIVGTKLTIVCDSFIEIPYEMFASFISLEKVTGLSSVTTIGYRAFFKCFSVKEIDLDPTKLTSIGDDAFRLSCVEDILDLSNLPANAVIGDRATRAKRWGNELAAVQAVAFPAHRIFFDVPNADSQQREKYHDIPFVRPESIDGESTLYNGCSVFTLYHTWNCLYAGSDKVYTDMEAWWTATLNKTGDYAEKTVFDSDEFWQYNTSTLGWEYDRNTNQVSVTSSNQLETILNELSNGLPVNTTIKTATAFHNVLIIGCDPVTRKLAFVDSGARPDRGVVYWCAFEDVYIAEFGTQDASECIRLMDYNVPMLAEKDTWYTQGGTTVKRATITEIEMVQSYELTGSETAFWDASAEKNGSVMAYVNETEDGTKLTIVNNGYRLIYANQNSSYAFSDTQKADYYEALTTINGAALLNTSKATDMSQLFRDCWKLESIDDVSNWNTSSCTLMTMMFARCYLLQFLDVSKWETSKVTKMTNLFLLCEKLDDLDVSNWDVSACVDDRGLYGVFQGCNSLRELDISKWDMTDCVDTTWLFDGMYRLEKITLGENFVFKNTSDANSQILYAPSAKHIPYADGYWYDYDYNAYAPADIPNNVARTYYASKLIAADDDDQMVFVRNGTLRKMAVALRHKNGTIDAMLPSAFGDEVLAKAESENSLVSGTVQDYYNDRIEHIGRSLGYNTSLISVRFPNVKSMEMCAFSGCMNLVQVDMPALMHVADSAFADCMQLAQIDLPEVESIDMESFKGCMNLSTLILRNTFADHAEEVCVLVDVNAFRDTPIASGTGYIYVPDELVDQYKGADNWSTFVSQIRPISQLEE